MATIKFFIQSKNNPAGIYIRLRDGIKVDAKAKTKFLVNPADWSKTKSGPKKDESLKKLVTDLSTLSAKVLREYNNSDPGAVNSDWLKAVLNPALKAPSIPADLVSYFDYYIRSKNLQEGSSTYKKINVIKRMIERFETSQKAKFMVKDVGQDFISRYESFSIESEYAPNTIARAIKYIKTICKHARFSGLETHHQIDAVKVRLSRGDKTYLTTEELFLIESKEYEHEYLDNARDWLLISCETGQRVSDFMRFKKDMIRYEDSKPLIEFTQVKTGRIMSIPLSKRVLRILGKRAGEFPRAISDQKYNVYIKDVCKEAGLTQHIQGSRKSKEKKRKESGVFEKWELITSHVGRRSFASNNYGRIPTSLLISATGHGSEKMFLEYIGKTDTEKAKQLADYF